MNHLIDIYFRQVSSGTLGRLQYLLYFLLASVIWTAVGVAIAVSFGVAEHIVGGNIEDAQAMLEERFSMVFVLGLAVLIAILGFACLNIAAKRIRDIGLPVWSVFVAFLALSMLVAAYASTNVQSGLSTLFFLLMVLVPGRAFARAGND